MLAYHPRTSPAMPRRLLAAVLALLLALGAWPAAALESRSGAVVSLDAGQIVDDDFAAFGRTITIAGHITGDLFAGGNTVTILPDARIDGDIFAAGETIIINGTVGGSVRTAGSTVLLNGSIGRNVLAGGAQITLSPNAAVKGNWLAGAATMILQGAVNGNVAGGADSMQIAGAIGRDVQLGVETLIIQPGARIGGDLTYTAAAEQRIPTGVVQGAVEHRLPPEQPRQQERGPDLLGGIFSLILLAGTILVGLLIAWRFPSLYRAAQSVIERRSLAAFGVGLVALIVVPVVAVILMITVLGLPLGLLSLGAWLTGWYIGWLLAATALAGLAVGIVRRNGRPVAIAWLVLLGLVGLHVLTRLPYVGGLLAFVVLCLGLGTLVILIAERLRRPDEPAVGLEHPAAI